MATVIVVPDVDGLTNDWSLPVSLPHYDDIDEGPGSGIDFIGASFASGDHNDIEMFGYENPSFEGQLSSQVVIYTNCQVVIGGGINVTLDIGGETHGPVSVGAGTGRAWKSNTFTPDGANWTEAQAASMKVTYTASVGVTKYGVNIFTSYASFTYEPPAPPGYGHNFLGVPAANIGFVNGVPTANIAKIKGV